MMIEKIERLANSAEKFTGILDKIPRLAEMFGVAVFAGRASERLGGDFAGGALGGIVADGLAHSNIPHNQIGGIALAAYFASIGFINAFVPVDDDEEDDDIRFVFEQITLQECVNRGGKVIDTGDTGLLFLRGEVIGRSDTIVTCRLTLPPEPEPEPIFDFSERPGLPGQIRR